jgi:hypothetical protein
MRRRKMHWFHLMLVRSLRSWNNCVDGRCIPDEEQCPGGCSTGSICLGNRCIPIQTTCATVPCAPGHIALMADAYPKEKNAQHVAQQDRPVSATAVCPFTCLHATKSCPEGKVCVNGRCIDPFTCPQQCPPAGFVFEVHVLTPHSAVHSFHALQAKPVQMGNASILPNAVLPRHALRASFVLRVH